MKTVFICPCCGSSGSMLLLGAISFLASTASLSWDAVCTELSGGVHAWRDACALSVKSYFFTPEGRLAIDLPGVYQGDTEQTEYWLDGPYYSWDKVVGCDVHRY